MNSTETQNIPSENKWYLTEKQLDTRCGPGVEEGVPIQNGPEWFHFNNKNGGLSGDTQQEITEQKQAIMEQIRLGILKQTPRKEVPIIAPNQIGALNPQMQQFMQHIKMKPQSIPTNNFRPKVIDQKTGKRRKLGPNDKCPCGSGKKFKKCHGRGQF